MIAMVILAGFVVLAIVALLYFCLAGQAMRCARPQDVPAVFDATSRTFAVFARVSGARLVSSFHRRRKNSDEAKQGEVV